MAVIKKLTEKSNTNRSAGADAHSRQTAGEQTSIITEYENLDVNNNTMFIIQTDTWHMKNN